MPPFTTTILGREYAGRPMFGSFALHIWLMEQKHGREAAERHNASHKYLCTCGSDEHDFAADMTTLPMDGLVTCPTDQLTQCVGDPLLRRVA